MVGGYNPQSAGVGEKILRVSYNKGDPSWSSGPGLPVKCQGPVPEGFPNGNQGESPLSIGGGAKAGVAGAAPRSDFYTRTLAFSSMQQGC